MHIVVCVEKENYRMPIIDPRKPDTHIPHDWRLAFDEFNRLRKLAKLMGISIIGWTIEYPPWGEKLFRAPMWKMSYVPNNRSRDLITVYLGGTGREAAHTIHTIYVGMRAIAEAEIRFRDAFYSGDNPKVQKEILNRTRERFKLKNEELKKRPGTR